MTTLTFLADWALRGTVLFLAAGLILELFRVRDVSIRLAAWKAILLASLALPLLLRVTPPLFHVATRTPAATIDLPLPAPVVRQKPCPRSM